MLNRMRRQERQVLEKVKADAVVQTLNVIGQRTPVTGISTDVGDETFPDENGETRHHAYYYLDDYDDSTAVYTRGGSATYGN